MTSWQDPQDRGGRGRSADGPATGQPTSRRAAREAERRAAEALQERQPHPSGVVDFDAHDFSSDFTPDQAFDVGDTQDIWAALTRGSGRPPVTGGAPAVRQPEPGRGGDASSVNGELLDRVRDAVLRRGQEHGAAPSAPSSFDESRGGATRRERRMREAAEAREDDLPANLFADRGPVAAAPAPREVPPPQPAALQGHDEYDDYDDGYYDEPYAPEPTIVIPSMRPAEPQAPRTSPVAFPQSFAEPMGDDAITFSSASPAGFQDDGYDDDDLERAASDPEPSFLAPQAEPWDLQPRAASRAVPTPGTPFLEPQQPRGPVGAGTGGFANPELGPPSEVTDLAGFEALIRKARQQPGPAAGQPQPAQRQEPARPQAFAWADDEEVQEGFTGLLSRSAQASHGSSNALILPTDPQPDLTQAVSGNGDIFITGSLNLPRSLSTSGTTAEHEAHDIDAMFDGSDDEPAAGISPVRAARAVSGSTEHRVVSGVRRRRGNVLPTVLAVVAGAMAVGLVVLLIGSRLSGLF